FSDERVIRAAGGAGALSDWLLRHVKSCQWLHGDYHHSETVIHRYGTGAMVLCWHCDNQLREQTSDSLDQLAQQNLAAWMIDIIRHAMNGAQERELSLAELSWWAVRNQVADALPEAVLRRDLDNILKAPLDALTHAGLLMDDEQFDEINIVRAQPVSGGRLGVKIYPIMLEGQVKK
ncbi:RusA family crossover junction endodeoxyribonuclease, partial [Escherichia coli]|uniref:RusA family crossover junction endodeoxyribonuclease n=1 Tax=Escherichia coli TaxID=562 RepID=UPI003F4BB9CF